MNSEKLSRKQKKLFKKQFSMYWVLKKSGKTVPLTAPGLHLRPYDVHVKTVLKWAKKFELGHRRRRISYTRIGDVEISTVFLGINNNFSMRGKPILFETMVFGGVFDKCLNRYSTIKKARKTHNVWVKMVEKTIHPDER